MKFIKLKLKSNNLQAQQEFYGKLLGFPLQSSSPGQFTLVAGNTNLSFQTAGNHTLYHFAFLIPTGSLESAIDFVESRGISLLPLNDEKIIHFDSGRSIYFFDPDGNIAEFIERPKLAYPPRDTFTISDVICVNEIGHPVDHPIEASHELIEKHSIQPISIKSFRDNFCWVGDHEGAIIVVSNGRHWLPTNIPGELNDFDLEYSENHRLYRLRCQSGKASIY